MKVYLDDERVAPEGWEHVRWPDEAITLLQSGNVKEISLDHDLGDDERGTGYDVVLWIEEAVVTSNFKPPKIKVHSANSSAREKMELGIEKITKYTAKKWKAAEVMLLQASEFLFHPEKFNLSQRSLNEYEKDLRVDELEVAMLNLEDIAKKNGAKSGFWRRIKKAAVQMDLHEKVDEYESAFREALANSSE